MRLMKRVAALAAAAGMGAGAAWAVPVVSNVTMTQRAGTRIVDIAYELSGEAAVVTLGIETNGVALPDSAVTRLTGDVCKVVQTGSRALVWNAGGDWPEHVVTEARARVTAWSVGAPPLYLVIDLSAGPAAGSYPVRYHVSAEALPDGGLTNDLYRLDRLVMRRIRTQAAYPETGVFMMGSPEGEYYRQGVGYEDRHQVTLTKDYYLGVFEVTQWQWRQVTNARPAKWSHADYWMTRPVESVTYNDIRGSAAEGGGGWPTDSAASAASFIGLLRAKTGVAGLDLPTGAQWEYASRAGTTGSLNDGTVNLAGAASDPRLDLLGRYQGNGGQILVEGAWVPDASMNAPVDGSLVTVSNATAKAGSYLPNAWGLYDMHGNVWKWCLDYFVSSFGFDPVIDPVGADTGTDRTIRGGGWSNAAEYNRVAFPFNLSPADTGRNVGLRLASRLP